MSYEDEIIDLNEGFEDEPIQNEFAIDIEGTDVNSKKRKIAETIGSGEQDTSEIEHARKSAKNNLEQANEWFSSFFNPNDNAGSQSDGNEKAVSNNNPPVANPTSNTTAAESRISTKHLASASNSTATSTPAPTASPNNTPTKPSAPKIPVGLPIGVMPMVLPASTKDTASNPVIATLVTGVPGSPKQSIRFSITSQGIVPPTTLPATNNTPQKTASNTPLVQPIQKPAQPSGTAATNKPTNPLIPPPQPNLKNGLVFRLQDSATALAVVQKALEQKRAELNTGTAAQANTTTTLTPAVPTSVPAITTPNQASAPKAPITANRAIAPNGPIPTTNKTRPKAPITVNRASTPTIGRAIAPTAQASSTPNTSTTANRAGSTITSTQSTAVVQLSPTPSNVYASPPPGRVPMHLPNSNAVPVPKQYPSNTPTTSSNVRASPAGLKYSNPPTSTTMPSPTNLKRSFGTSHAPTSIAPSSQQARQPQPIQPAPARNTSSQPQPQERAKNNPPPSTSYSAAPRPAVVPPQRAISPLQREISPPQRTTSPAVSVAHPQYHDFQEQYRRLISDQYRPPTIIASQPGHGAVQTSQVQQAQHVSSQPSSHAQPASHSYSQQAQFPAQQYQYPSQSQLQPQYSYSSQPNVQTSATSQSNSLRVSVNPTRGTVAVHSQTVEEAPATSQSNYYNSFGPQSYLQHQQQRPYEYSAYPQTSSQYDSSSVGSSRTTDSTTSTATIAPRQSQHYNQSTNNVEAAAQQVNTTASNHNSATQAQGQQLSVQGDATTIASAINSATSNISSQAQPPINTATTQPANTSTNNQPQPTPIVNNNNTQTPSTTSDKVDSTSVNKAADPPISTSVEPSTSELTSNSKSDDDEVIILGTNNMSGKPVRRSVTLPPRRLVPSSASGSRPTSPINSENNNNNGNNNTTVTSTPQTSTTSSSRPSEVPTSATVAEPMEVDIVSQANQAVASDEVTPVTAQVPEIQLQLPVQSNSGSQVNNSTERDRCKLLSTSKFLRKSSEITSNNNNNNGNGPQNNNPLYIDVPDADQSELNRLRPNTRPRQQIYRTDEYWSYWSAASQSQASQEAGQDEQSERDNTSLAHSQDDLGQLTQQYHTEDVQPAPAIQVEQQQQQAVQQTSTDSLARSSEFGLSNFDVDVQMHVTTNASTVPRLNVTNSNNYANASRTAPATSPRQYVQPNSAGFSNNSTEGNNNNTSSSTSPPRIIGPLDKYFRVSPDKITNTTTAATVPQQQQQQYTAVSSYNESDVITINDSQEDPSARANNVNYNSVSMNSYNNNMNSSSVNAASNYMNSTVNYNAHNYDYTSNANSYSANDVNNNTASYMNSSVNANDYMNNSSVIAANNYMNANNVNNNTNNNTNYTHDYTNNTNSYSGVNYNNVTASDYMNNTVNNTAATNYTHDYTNNAGNANNYNYANTANTYSVNNNNNIADTYMNDTVPNSAANNYNNNNTMNNSTVTYNEAYQPSRAKSPDNLRQSHGGSEKSKSDGSKSHQKVLMPYIADGPVVLTRIEPAPAWHGGLLWPGLGTIKQQYMELFIPNDPRLQSIPYIAELPKLLMAREMSISDSQTMPTGHYCIQLISPVLDKHSLPKAFWDPNYKAFWTLKMHYNNLLLCIGPKMIERKTILCLYITVQGPTPQQQQPITCTLSAVPADMLNFFRGLNMEHYYHEFQRNGINSLYAMCQITKEQMETVINGTDVIAVMAELKKLVAEMIRLSRTNTRTYNEYFHDGSM